VKKGHREAERILTEMGFTILGSQRGGSHHYWLLRCPDGREIKQGIPHAVDYPRFWHNWKMQLRRRLDGTR
jgi:hypothetical protein